MNTIKKTDFSPFNQRDITAFLSLLSPVIFILCAAFYFHEFVWHAIEANLGINMGIIGAATFGIVLIILRMLAAQTDFRTIARFGYESGQGVYMKTLLEKPWLKNRYVRHYLSHIAHTGGTLSSQLEQSSIESELHALQADYDSRLELPQFLVGFMIAMGLLGTFIGLLETLTGISGMLDGMGGSGEDVQKQFMKLVVELRKPLAGMGIAFSASMFGLITSLMLAIMMTVLRRFISRVISLARNVMHDLTEQTRETSQSSMSGSLSPDDIDAMLYKAEIGESAQSMAGVTGFEMTPGTGMSSGGGRGVSVGDAALAGRIDVLAKRIEALLESFAGYTESTRRFNDLLGVGPRMKETGEKTLEELRGISASHKEQQRLLQGLIAVNTDAARSIGGLAETHKQSHAEQQGTLQTLIDTQTSLAHTVAGLTDSQRHLHSEQLRSAQALIDVNADAARNVRGLLEAQRLGQVEQQREMQTLIEASAEATRMASGMLAAQRDGRSEVAALIIKLQEQLADNREVNLGSARHLNDIKESFIKLCDSLGLVNLIASGVGGHTLLLEALVEEARRSQQGLAVINRSIQDTKP